jgi:hypothetical protein
MRPHISRTKTGADDQNRTGDLVLTKDALCRLSYIGLRASRSADRSTDRKATSLACQPEARHASGGWSGRRGSNPRPTAWKAVTLPLSYSRPRRAQARLPSSARPKPRRRYRPEGLNGLPCGALRLTCPRTLPHQTNPPHRFQRLLPRSDTAAPRESAACRQITLRTNLLRVPNFAPDAVKELVGRGGFEPP